MQSHNDHNIAAISQSFMDCGLKIYDKIHNQSFNKVNLKKNFNPSGEESLTIDVIAESIVLEELKKLSFIYALVSEEKECPIILNEKGTYIVFLDPLDGSKNLFTNDACGSIFSVYKRTNDNLITEGKNQVLAAYCIYSYSLIFTLSQNNFTNIHIYDKNKWELIFQNYNMPKGIGKYYSINEGYEHNYFEKTHTILEYLKNNNLSLRYSGSFVVDFHRILLSGGIFMYPSQINKKKGKLRLMYENNPLAFIIQNSSGRAIDGKNNILDVKPKGLHDTSPIFIGSKILIENIIDF